MAELSLRAPEPLVIDIASTSMALTWETWVDELEVYFVAANIQDTKRKKALLLYCGGDDLRKVHRTLNDDKETYADTKALLGTYFKPKCNLTFERNKFYTCAQAEGETIAAFVTKLRDRARSCKFDEYNVDSAITDQVIHKCASTKLRRRLLREPDLTLEKLLSISHATESSEQQATAMEHVDHSLNRISLRGPFRKPLKSPTQDRLCYGCGNGGHLHGSKECPAKGKRCNFCKKPNHFASVCFKNSSRGDSEDSRDQPNVSDPRGQPTKAEGKPVEVLNMMESSDDEYVFTLGASRGRCHDVSVKVDGVDVSFMVDSGASCNIIDSDTFDSLKERINITLEGCSSNVYTYGSENALQLRGSFYANVTTGTSTCYLVKFIVPRRGRSGCLLGRETATLLGLLQINRINTVQQDDGPPPSKKVSGILSKYSNVKKGLGKLKDVQIKYDINPSVKPVSQHLRKVPFHLRKKIDAKLDELLAADVIEPAPVTEATPWVSPLLAVPKGDDIRLVIDMRQPNKAIERVRHPIPTVDETLEKYNRCTVFSKIDLKHGYFQLELAPESRSITTFSTHRGLFRNKRLVQGTNTAFELYQFHIGQLFDGYDLINNISDDIIIGGVGQEDHDKQLEACLRILQEHHLTINLKKCQFGRTEINFFGFSVSASGVKPTYDKLETVMQYKEPENAKEVRSFLGLINFFGRFIQNLSAKTHILRQLTRKGAPWQWEQEHRDVFEQLKQEVCQETVLAHYDQTRETFLIVDASPIGLGAILAQKQECGTMRPVYFASKTLSKTESNYSQIEREALAVWWGCKRFHLYLYGSPFVVLTDHKPLKTLMTANGKPSARILKWTLNLQSYSFTVKHIKGCSNPADILSRQPSNEDDNINSGTELYINSMIANSVPKAVSFSEILDASKKDPVVTKICSNLQTNRWTKDDDVKPYFKVKEQLSMKSGVLLKDARIVVPASLRKRILKIAHEGHQGMTKTKALVRTKVWWPGIDKDIEEEIRTCLPCISVSAPSPPEPLIPTSMPDPWQKLHVDMYGPMPTGESILGIIDSCSRWAELHIIKSTTSSTIAARLHKTFTIHGFPEEIVTDNAPNLRSVDISDYCDHYAIKHSKACPYWPQGNAEIERFYRTLGKAIRTLTVEGRDWRTAIDYFLFQYRSTPHSTTKESPAKLLMGRELKGKLPALPVQSDSVSLSRAKLRDSQQKTKSKVYFDKRFRSKHSHIENGDLVLLKQAKKNKLSTTFDTRPYQVVSVRGTVAIIKRDNIQIMRNLSLLKKIPPSSIVPKTTDQPRADLDDDDRDFDSSGLDLPIVPQPLPPRPERPQRQRRPPLRFADYEPH